MPSRDAGHGDAAAFGYVVANPHGIRKGERILSWEDEEWFEGDAFVSSGMMPPDMVEWLIDEGVLVATTSDPEAGRTD